ncbi:MAG: V4R domain-containing protein [Candidatus Nezhaarchaeales archaeon]
MRFGRSVDLFIFSGRFVVCISMLISPEAKNPAMVLGDVIHSFCRPGIPVVFVKMSRPSPGSKTLASIFVDATNKMKAVQDAVERIKTIEFVESVKLIEPSASGFTIDNTPRYLTLVSERTIMLRKTCYEALIKGLRKKFGSGHKAYLYHIGFEIGRSSYNWITDIVENPYDVLKIAQEMFKHMGFGAVEVNLENRKVRVWDSFECELFKGSKECESHLIRGMISGFLSSFLGEEIMATEVKCIAKGGPYCEYTF